MPQVSIITAAYKTRRDHLETALRSAIGQTFADFDLLVSDDSPTPALADVVASFNDSRLRYRHNQPALGVAENHWRCFAESSAPFIAVLNHDDSFEPDFLSCLILPLQSNPSLALAFCDHWIIDDTGKRLIEQTEHNTHHWKRDDLAPGVHRPFFDLILSQSIPMVMGSVFRRSALPQEFPRDAGPGYDLWLAYLLACSGMGAHFIPARLSSWRTHAINLTSQGGVDWSLGSAKCWRAMAENADAQHLRARSLQKASGCYKDSSRRAAIAGNRLLSLKYAAQSFKTRPSLKSAASLAIPLAPAAFLK